MVVRDALRPEHDVVRARRLRRPDRRCAGRRRRRRRGVRALGPSERAPELVAGEPCDPTVVAAAIRPSRVVDDRRRNRGRTVVQAWLASRGTDRCSSRCCSPSREDREFARVVAQWDVEHFTDLATGGYLGRRGRHPDGVLPRAADAAAGRAWLGLPVDGHRRDRSPRSARPSRPRPCSDSADRGPRWPGCSLRRRCSPSCPTPRRCSARPPSGPGNGPAPTTGRPPPCWPRPPAPSGSRGCSWSAPCSSCRSPATGRSAGRGASVGRRLRGC